MRIQHTIVIAACLALCLVAGCSRKPSPATDSPQHYPRLTIGQDRIVRLNGKPTTLEALPEQLRTLAEQDNFRLDIRSHTNTVDLFRKVDKVAKEVYFQHYSVTFGSEESLRNAEQSTRNDSE